MIKTTIDSLPRTIRFSRADLLYVLSVESVNRAGLPLGNYSCDLTVIIKDDELKSVSVIIKSPRSQKTDPQP